MRAQDLFEKVTNEMVAAIEAGAGEWRMPWHTLAEAGTPHNVDGRPYRGMNVLWLPMVAAANGWSSGVWATYKAWQRHGAQVCRGSKGTPVVFWKQHVDPKPTAPRPGDDEDRREGDDSPGRGRRRGSDRLRWIACGYTVFAAEQVDGADEVLERRADHVDPREAPERIRSAEAYFAGLGATVTEQGSRAFYSLVTDSITVPPLAQFDDSEHFYGVLAHEHVHWTGHPDRCGRDLSGRFGSDSYAAEELVAELGAAMWCAQAGIAPATRQDHASYLAHWLEILRANPRHLLSVASKAQQAVDWMNTRTDPALSAPTPSATVAA